MTDRCGDVWERKYYPGICSLTNAWTPMVDRMIRLETNAESTAEMLRDGYLRTGINALDSERCICRGED